MQPIDVVYMKEKFNSFWIIYSKKKSRNERKITIFHLVPIVHNLINKCLQSIMGKI